MYGCKTNVEYGLMWGTFLLMRDCMKTTVIWDSGSKKEGRVVYFVFLMKRV